MQIIDLTPDDGDLVTQTAKLLIAAFKDGWPEAWPDMDSALETVADSFGPERISRALIDDSGRVLGWIGGIRDYDGYVWELHPLAVSPGHQGRGIGTLLVRDFEEQVRARGGITITLGSDDVSGMTTLSGIDLYPDVSSHITSIRNLRRHPFEFYRKMGYVITGVVPDANGPGKPDILMSKRVAPDSTVEIGNDQVENAINEE